MVKKIEPNQKRVRVEPSQSATDISFSSSSAVSSSPGSTSDKVAPVDQSKAIKLAPEVLKALADFYGRDLIQVPLVRRRPVASVNQRCGLKAATLELDTAGYPNIEYIAGTRLSVYPVNPSDQVDLIIRHLYDDLGQPKQSSKSHSNSRTGSSASSNISAVQTQTGSSLQPTPSATISAKTPKQSQIAVDPLGKFVQALQSETNQPEQVLRLALAHLFDITTPPLQGALKMIGEHCSDQGQREQMLALAKSQAAWKRWLTTGRRTLASTLTDQASSCKQLPARRFLSELAIQQPRLYSIANIRSAQRFRTEIIVFQRNFKVGFTSYGGLCSSYLLSLQPNEPSSSHHILCQFVENPRFTLKGNRERPIMMIGQDVGVVAFRAFWQQRKLEYDRAQIFYTFYKDLNPKKFGDMQMVCLTGNKCQIEEIFRQEMDSFVTQRILSSVTRLDREHLLGLHKRAGPQKSVSDSSLANASTSQQSGYLVSFGSKDLSDLGARIYKLLVEQNGCLYTCCDPKITQAIEMLIIESVARFSNGKMSAETTVGMLPKWRGRIKTINKKFLFAIENPFERAQIVEEIYDSTL